MLAEALPLLKTLTLVFTIPEPMKALKTPGLLEVKLFKDVPTEPFPVPVAVIVKGFEFRDIVYSAS